MRRFNEEIISSQPKVNPAGQVKPDDLAYIIYTSGSTGQPKGVQISHQNLVHSTYARIEYYPDQVSAFLLLSSYAFDSSVAGIFGTLCQGGTLVLSPARIEQDMTQIGVLISENQISHILCLPVLYNLIIEHVDTKILQSLKTITVAGEACTGEVVKSHNSLLPKTKLYNEYGPTEGTVWCTVYEATAKSDYLKVSIGRPIANMKAFIFDQYRNPVPIGVPGELYIGGKGLAVGYLNRPKLTEDQFILHEIPGMKAIRLYKTGDLVKYLPDGNIEFIGRVDDQIKIRGYRVELEEIESALLQHTGIQETAVIPNNADITISDDMATKLSRLIYEIETNEASNLLEEVEGLSEEAVEMLLFHGS